MRNRGIVGLMVFCALVTAVSLGALALPPAPVQQAVPQPLCVLRDDGGRLALWQPDGSLICRYDIYTRLLPDADAERLCRGVDIYSRGQLEQLLEDYGG